jgi:hypothetical protein
VAVLHKAIVVLMQPAEEGINVLGLLSSVICIASQSKSAEKE